MITKKFAIVTAAAVMLIGVGVTIAAPAQAASYRTYSNCSALHKDLTCTGEGGVWGIGAGQGCRRAGFGALIGSLGRCRGSSGR
jgi:hypothetical protein